MTLEKCTLIEPFQCQEDEAIVEVAKKLRTCTLRQIFVTDSMGKPIGVISTTDMNNRIVAEGKDPTTLKARDIMTTPIETFQKTDDAMQVYKEMKEKKRLLCAVMDGEKFIGMVTLGETLKCVAER
jgi:CBS domain-containing protein